MGLTAAAIVPAAVQGAIGLAQAVGGLFKKKPKRPVMSKNTAATEELVSTSRMRAQSTTDAALQGALGEIDKSAANAASTMRKSSKDVGDLVGGVSRVQAGVDTAKRAAQNEFGRRQQDTFFQFMRALNQSAAEERQAFEWNDAMKYQEDAATRSALIGGGIQNAVGALGDMSALQMYQQMGLLGDGAGSITPGRKNPNLSVPTLNPRSKPILPRNWQNSIDMLGKFLPMPG
jgi:hypothetical protein